MVISNDLVEKISQRLTWLFDKVFDGDAVLLPVPEPCGGWPGAPSPKLANKLCGKLKGSCAVAAAECTPVGIEPKPVNLPAPLSCRLLSCATSCWI